jgi:hypothetical protein
MGFESFTAGERQLRFSVDEPGHEPLQITFDLAGAFFSGENRLLVQEAAGICYSKLRAILNAESDPDLESIIAVTASDIVQYRRLRTPRAGHRRPRV